MGNRRTGTGAVVDCDVSIRHGQKCTVAYK